MVLLINYYWCKGEVSMKKSVEFIGKPTGDGECFCWEVDEENFMKATNEVPDEIMDYIGGKYSHKDGKFIGGKLMVYPNSIFSEMYLDNEEIYRHKIQKKIRIKISFEELD